MAATPAMVMTGAALCPIIGGALVKALDYASLGVAAFATAALAVAGFSHIPWPMPAATFLGATK